MRFELKLQVQIYLDLASETFHSFSIRLSVCLGIIIHFKSVKIYIISFRMVDG